MTYELTTAATVLRQINLPGVGDIYDPTTVLKQWVADKGYNLGVVKDLAHRQELSDFIHTFFVNGTQRPLIPWDYFGSRLHTLTGSSAETMLRPYTGSVGDHVEFMNAHTIFSSRDAFIGFGASAQIERSDFGLPSDYEYVRIGIIGAGAAGIMVAHELASVGFRRIDMIAPKTLGIWSQGNVYLGSRNNPRRLTLGEFRLDAAPGDGQEVQEFLDNVLSRSRRFGVNFIEDKVAKVTAGNLKHKVRLARGSEHEYDILINALGLGAPTSLNDPERMIVINDDQKGAIRWQKSRLSGPEVQGKMFIFVGLGNSTAEMINQLHDLMDKGYEVDYRILTHFPRDAVMNPSTTVWQNGKSFRVFRDLSQPDLTGYQGDLEHSRRDYYRALTKNRIVSGVKRWGTKEVPSGKVIAFGPNSKKMSEVSYDHLYVLTGYKHTEAVLNNFDCVLDEQTGAVRYDYDGEVMADVTKSDPSRLHRGYYVLGAVADAPHNRNAVVIPGMLSMIPALTGGVIMRAGEKVRQHS